MNFIALIRICISIYERKSCFRPSNKPLGAPSAGQPAAEPFPLACQVTSRITHLTLVSVICFQSQVDLYIQNKQLIQDNLKLQARVDDLSETIQQAKSKEEKAANEQINSFQRKVRFRFLLSCVWQLNLSRKKKFQQISYSSSRRISGLPFLAGEPNGRPGVSERMPLQSQSLKP